MFDECKGDMLQDLLSAFSTMVVQKTLLSEEVGRSCIVGRLCADAQSHSGDHSSMLPLSIAHKASLMNLLQRKRTLKARYRDFNQSLQNKDSKLLDKFDKVVEAQIYIDKNPPSEDTVERVSKVLDQYWQGDQKQIDVIAQGEEHRLTDALLDHTFEALWQRVNVGSFDGDISTSKVGLLHDLEKRVAKQQARLQQWKDVKSEMEQKKQSNGALTPTSPVKKALGSPHSYRYEQRRGKDLVFSPRKSPRKSMQPSGPPVGVVKLEEPGDPPMSTKPSLSTPVSINGFSSDVVSSPLAAKSKTLSIDQKGALFSSNGVDGEDNNSDLSEVSIAAGTSPKMSNVISPCPKINDVNEYSLSTSKNSFFLDTESNASENTKESLRQMDGQNGMAITEKPGKVDILAEPVVVCTVDTNRVPPQQQLPLTERTRQSMAFTSPKASLPFKESSPLVSLPTPQPKPALEDPNVRATLAERTRQSISLLPAKPKHSRESSHNRRMSKNYPTNQFETPRRQKPVSKMTPPEELMSPGAGYDSVFKSRPKVAFSPPTSPVPSRETAGKAAVDSD